MSFCLVSFYALDLQFRPTSHPLRISSMPSRELHAKSTALLNLFPVPWAIGSRSLNRIGAGSIRRFSSRGKKDQSTFMIWKYSESFYLPSEKYVILERKISSYQLRMILTINNLNQQDDGNYVCVSGKRIICSSGHCLFLWKNIFLPQETRKEVQTVQLGYLVNTFSVKPSWPSRKNNPCANGLFLAKRNKGRSSFNTDCVNIIFRRKTWDQSFKKLTQLFWKEILFINLPGFALWCLLRAFYERGNSQKMTSIFRLGSFWKFTLKYYSIIFWFIFILDTWRVNFKHDCRIWEGEFRKEKRRINLRAGV